jgi:hypothetical protein
MVGVDCVVVSDNRDAGAVKGFQQEPGLGTKGPFMAGLSFCRRFAVQDVFDYAIRYAKILKITLRDFLRSALLGVPIASNRGFSHHSSQYSRVSIRTSIVGDH